MPKQSKEQTDPSRRGQVPSAPRSVDDLASHALSMVAKRSLRGASEFDPDLAQRLRDAAAGDSSETVQALITDMLSAGLEPETVAMVYIPHVARQLGDEWCDDTLSFARVTIGTSRLQASLRLLGTEWTSHGYAERPNANGGVIVIVAKDAFHTLGAMVLCGHLRRLGHSVRLAMGATPQELAHVFKTSQFDAVLISASEFETLDSLRKCVDIIRQSSSDCPPIVIGGSVLDQDADVRLATGADFVTRDPIEALNLCGLTKENIDPIKARRT